MNCSLVFDAAQANGHVSEAQAKDVVAAYGVSTPRRALVADRAAARSAFATLRTPLAVKLVSAAVHKSDIGGVRLNISTQDELDQAIAAVERGASAAEVDVRGFLIEEMAPAGIEVLVGGVTDPVFGPAVVLGMGGIFAEVYNDIATRICPVSQRDVEAMIHEIRAAPLLLGARGQPAVDVAALGRIVMAIGGAHGLLMDHAHRIREIDLNPVIVSTSGAIAVDARIILQPPNRHDT